jgi:hypothetical protein
MHMNECGSRCTQNKGQQSALGDGGTISPTGDPVVRAELIRAAFRLEWLTIAWMIIEAAVAIGAGIAAHSLLLMAFGIDSLIELASACVLVWRLSVELRRGQAFSEVAERRASRIAGGLLFALALYVVMSAGFGFWRHYGAEFSTPGSVLAVAAIPIMYLLARRKLALARTTRKPRASGRCHRKHHLWLAIIRRGPWPGSPARPRRLVG